MKRLSHFLLALVLLVGVSACRTQSEPHASTWQEQYDLGIHYLSEGNYQEAIIAFTSAIEIAPNQAAAYIGRGDAYIDFGGTEEKLSAAQADYEMAVELDDASAEAYLGLAEVHIRREKYDLAIDILKVALEKIQQDISILEKIAELEELMENDAPRTSDLINVENFLCPEEMTIKGIPFYQLSIFDVRDMFGDDSYQEELNASYSDGETYVYYNGRNYSANSHINADTLGSFRYKYHPYGPDSLNMQAGEPPEFRNLKAGDQLGDVLAKIGISPRGVEKMLKHRQDDDFTLIKSEAIQFEEPSAGFWVSIQSSHYSGVANPKSVFISWQCYDAADYVPDTQLLIEFDEDDRLIYVQLIAGDTTGRMFYLS